MKKIIGEIKNIFDFSFKTFITIKVLRIIYWVQVMLGGGIAVVFIYYGFQESIVLGIVTVIIAPIAFLIYAVLLRVIIEIIIVIFKIAGYTKQISEAWNETKKEHEEKKKEKKRVEIEGE